ARPTTSTTSEGEACEEGKQGAWAPALPPVDHRVVAALDAVLTESDVLGRPCGAAPTQRADSVRVFEIEVPWGGMCQMKCAAHGLPYPLEQVFGNFHCGNATNGCVELGVGCDGMRCHCKVPCGGVVFHLLYEKGRCTTWTSEAEPTSSEECESG